MSAPLSENPASGPEVFPPVELGRCSEGFPVARVGDVAFAMLPGRDGRHYLASGWRISRPLAEWRRSDFYGHDGELADEAAFRVRIKENAEHQRERKALGRREGHSRAVTPWGTSQGATIYAEGVICHSTAGHGGFHLSAERNREVHPILREPFLAVCPRGKSPEDLPLIQYTARHLMGRQIAAHLARLGLKPAARFELDSYHAILAMVATGAGWAILTPLALHQARRFRAEVEVRPLPFAPLDRTLSLSARAGMLRDVPGQISKRLKGLIEGEVVQPMRAAFPFIGESLTVL